MKNSYVSVVINPTAGNGKAKKLTQFLLQKIKSSSDFELNIAFTKEKNDAVYITRKAIMEGATMIIAVGGDGTINEVVNGFFQDEKPLNPICELGVINCGTGGGYARTLNSPHSIELQIEQLLQPGSRILDLGRISYTESAGTKAERLFVNECQVGIGCKVAQSVGRKSKIFGGTIAFGISATLFALFMKPVKLKVGFDEDDLKELTLIGLVVGNGTECAGGMKLTPDAKLNDGYFDVLLMNEMQVSDRMLNLSKVYSGKHILSPFFSVKKCKKLQIRSDFDLSLESDGEILGNSPFDIQVLPSAIRVKAANINIQ